MKINKAQYKYSDIRIDFERHPFTRDIIRVTDDKSIRQSLINLILLNHNEALFAPWKGANLRGLLFENASPVVEFEIKRNIEHTIQNEEPRVILRDVIVKWNENDNSYDVRIEYEILGSMGELKVLQFPLRRAR